MISDLQIRAATPDDVSAIVDFNVRLAEETEGASLHRETLRRGVSGLLADRTRGRYDLACTEGRVIGQIMHTREWRDWRNGDIWWLQSVYVHQDYRRRGVFRALYEHVSTRAAADPGVVGLRLYVEVGNRSAQAAYEHIGMLQARYMVMQCLVGE